VTIEEIHVERGEVPVVGYYEARPRPTASVVLVGAGRSGRGECVAWAAEEVEAFARACTRRTPDGTTTVDVASGPLPAHGEPYARAALEAAVVDLALGQGATNLFVLSGRSPRPIAFCWSLSASPDPLVAAAPILAADPAARLKLDCPEDGWPDEVWRGLAESGRVAIVDFKRRGAPERVADATRFLPGAILEDPPLEARGSLEGSPAARVSLDGYALRAVDLEQPPFRPVAINVKAPRVGGPLEALRCLEACRANGWEAYFGGMFEVGVGREQARVLASLYTPSAWNDLAPVRRSPDEPYAASPLPAPAADFFGFAP